MATSKEYKNYVVDQLDAACGEITCRPMMGEFLLYFRGLLFGGIYDGRVLVKIVETNKGFGLKEEIPYKGAKPMFMIEDLEEAILVKEIVHAICQGLKK